LIDIRPKENSSYVRSSTEPFNEEMKLDQGRVKRWLVHFGLLQKESEWYHIHVSGHGSRDQLRHVVIDCGSKRVIPIHTENEEYYANWHNNVINVTLNSSIEI
jgi:ribonuclease J